jgi:hypothetical protein
LAAEFFESNEIVVPTVEEYFVIFDSSQYDDKNGTLKVRELSKNANSISSRFPMHFYSAGSKYVKLFQRRHPL